MTQTWALVKDAYRELNSKKLFWITLILSALVVVACGLVGINEKGVSFLHWQFDTPMMTTAQIARGDFYKMIFTSMAIPWWLTWAAAILALVSTGGIFPDFISSGSIELTLSKPIGRWRLFLTKYACGLLFAGLQVLVFSLAAFMVIGVRGGSWEWGIFLAVPIVVVFFSYLFSICVLLGIITRSTIASILLTLLIWFGISMLGSADGMLLMFKEQNALRAEDAGSAIARLETRLASQQGELAAIEESDGADVRPGDREARLASITGRIGMTQTRLDELRQEAEAGRRAGDAIEPWHRGVVMVRTVLPKTSDTIGLLGRWLVDTSGVTDAQIERREMEVGGEGEMRSGPHDPRLAKRLEDEIKRRPVWWIVGTSLGFECVVLLIAGWLFVRRDF